jgi:hypothetical protein
MTPCELDPAPWVISLRNRSAAQQHSLAERRRAFQARGLYDVMVVASSSYEYGVLGAYVILNDATAPEPVSTR